LAIDWPIYMIAQFLWRAQLLGSPGVMEMLQIQLTAAMVTMACVAIPSALGIHRVARIPVFGRFIAQLLVARGCSQLCSPQSELADAEQSDPKSPHPVQLGNTLPADLPEDLQNVL